MATPILHLRRRRRLRIESASAILPTFYYTTSNPLDGTAIASGTVDPLVLTFSKDVDLQSFPSPVGSVDGPIGGVWSLSGTSIQFDPFFPWNAGQDIDLDYSAITGDGGVALTNPGALQWPVLADVFTLDAQSTNFVADGSTDPISFTFSDDVDISSFGTPVYNQTNSADAPFSTAIAGSWSVSGPVATFTPSSPWAGSRIIKFNFTTATASTGGTALAATEVRYAMAANATFSFVDAYVEDGQLSDGEVERVVFEFDAPADLASLPTPTNLGGTAVTGTWARTSLGGADMTGSVVAFTPDNPWDAGEDFTFDFSGVIREVDGVALTNPGTATFSTIVAAGSLALIADGPDTYVNRNNTQIFVAFDNPVEITSLPNPTGTGSGVIGGTWADLGGNQYLFTASAQTIEYETITLDLTSAVQTPGATASLSNPTTLTWTSRLIMTIVSSNPVEGDVATPTAISGTSTPIDITFDRPYFPDHSPFYAEIVGSSTNAGPIAGTFSQLSADTMRFTPAAPWPEGSGVELLRIEFPGIQGMDSSVMYPTTDTRGIYIT